MRTILIGLLVFGWASVSYAQEAGSHCKLGDTTKLFSSKDGKKYSAKLPKGTTVVLSAKHGSRRMVKTLQGKMGFIKTKWIKKVCTFSTPDPAPKSEAKESAPIDAGSVMENVAALEVAKAVAEAPSPELKAVAQEQAKVAQKAKEARRESRQRECLEQEEANAFRIAVYNLELVNLPEGMGKIVSDALLAEVRKLEGISAIGLDEIEEMIQHEVSRQTMGCEADDACLAEIAGALGVDEIITGRMSEEADGRQLLIRRIDQARAEVVNTVNQRLAIGNGEEFLLALGPGVEKLYPNRKNRPGTKRGVPKKLLLRLNPPPIASSITWTTLGVAATSLIAGGVFAYLGDQKQNEYYNTAKSQDADLLDANEFKDIRTTGDQYIAIGNTSLMAGGALGLVGAIMSLFTDWDDIAGEEDQDE